MYICIITFINWLIVQLGFPGDSVVKNPHAKQEMRVRSLDGEDLLEKKMATHSSILAWRISWTEEPGGLQFMESQTAGHDLATKNNNSSLNNEAIIVLFSKLPLFISPSFLIIIKSLYLFLMLNHCHIFIISFIFLKIKLLHKRILINQHSVN